MAEFPRWADIIRKESSSQFVTETKMTKSEKSKRKKLAKGMKKNIKGFKERYGKRAKSVMYATATKQAMKESNIDEVMHTAIGDMTCEMCGHTTEEYKDSCEKCGHPIEERKMTGAEKTKREKIVKGIKSNMKDLKQRYGKRAKSVAYAIATKQAMKEDDMEEEVTPANITPRTREFAQKLQRAFPKAPASDIMAAAGELSGRQGQMGRNPILEKYPVVPTGDMTDSRPIREQYELNPIRKKAAYKISQLLGQKHSLLETKNRQVSPEQIINEALLTYVKSAHTTTEWKRLAVILEYADKMKIKYDQSIISIKKLKK